jgi:hypothetical protein
MLRIGLMLALAGVLAGCQHTGGASSGPLVASTYQCVPSDDASAQAGPATGKGHKPRRLTVFYDGAHQQAVVSVDGGSVNYLNLVPGEKEPLYTNSKYAWKGAGDTSVLTDIADIQVYSCTRAANPG